MFHIWGMIKWWWKRAVLEGSPDGYLLIWLSSGRDAWVKVPGNFGQGFYLELIQLDPTLHHNSRWGLWQYIKVPKPLPFPYFPISLLKSVKYNKINVTQKTPIFVAQQGRLFSFNQPRLFCLLMPIWTQILFS